MAYGFTSKADNAVSATGVSIPVNITVSAGDTLLVVWGGFTGALTSFTPADGTHTYVSASAAGAVVSTLTHRIATYYVINPTPGTYTITATLGATRANRRILAATYSGITAFQAAQPQGQVGAATTTDAVSTSNMTPSSQPALLTAVSLTANGTATYTAGTGHTSRGALTNWDAIGSFSSLFEDIRLTSTSAVAGLFTIGTSRDTLSSGAVFTEDTSTSTALTGQSATASAGSLKSSLAQTPTGQAATAAQGTATANVSYALTGQALSTAQGTLTSSPSQALSGQAATASAGTLAPAVSQALAGQSLTVSQGNVTVPGDVTIALTGQSITVSQGSLTAVVAVEEEEQDGAKDDERESRPGWIFDQYRSLQPKKVAAIERPKENIAAGIAPASTPAQVNALIAAKPIPAVLKPPVAAPIADDDEEAALMLLL